MRLDELEIYLNGLLEITQFHDYCPNGLQVEGRSEVHIQRCNCFAGIPGSRDSSRGGRRPGSSRLFLAWGGPLPYRYETPAYCVADGTSSACSPITSRWMPRGAGQ